MKQQLIHSRKIAAQTIQLQEMLRDRARRSGVVQRVGEADIAYTRRVMNLVLNGELR